MDRKRIQEFFDTDNGCGFILKDFTYFEMTILKMFGERLSKKFQEQSAVSMAEGNKHGAMFFASEVTKTNCNLAELDKALNFVMN